MLARPSPSRMYSAKSSESPGAPRPCGGRGPSGPLEPGMKWTRSSPMSARSLAGPVEQLERRRRGPDRLLDDRPREQDPAVRRAAAGRPRSGAGASRRRGSRTRARRGPASPRRRSRPISSGSRMFRPGRIAGPSCPTDGGGFGPGRRPGCAAWSTHATARSIHLTRIEAPVPLSPIAPRDTVDVPLGERGWRSSCVVSFSA